MKQARLRLTDIGRKQVHCYCYLQHSSKNILQREDKAAWGSMSQDSTRNTKHHSNSSSQPRLSVYSECSMGFYSLGPPLLYPHESLHKPVRFQIIEMHLHVLLTHLLTVQTPPRYADIKTESFPVSSYFTKYCTVVQTGGTKATRVCWDSMHIEQVYTWKGSLPTLQLQGKFLPFVTDTWSALKEEFSTQALSGRNQDPANAQLSK